MNVKKQKFAVLSSGEKVHLYTVSNDTMSFSVTNYGCIITSIIVPSAVDSERKGQNDDIVLGYSTFDGFMRDPDACFGAVVGRFANRIANAQFTLNGKEYNLDKNDGPNCLHSGFSGYNKMLWNAEEIETSTEVGVCFSRLSVDGEQGFPGNVVIKVSYTLTNDNEIFIRYEAISDQDTPLNLTNHAYFNLAGEGRGNVHNHTMMINSDSYVVVGEHTIPTGEMRNLIGTEFDFTSPKLIGQNIEAIWGYDHNYCLKEGSEPLELRLCAEVTEPTSKRKMTVFTTEPGVQFYTGNYLNVACGKNGKSYKMHDAFCLETQKYPDSPNQPTFPNCILKRGETFTSITMHKFEIV